MSRIVSLSLVAACLVAAVIATPVPAPPDPAPKPFWQMHGAAPVAREAAAVVAFRVAAEAPAATVVAMRGR